MIITRLKRYLASSVLVITVVFEASSQTFDCFQVLNHKINYEVVITTMETNMGPMRGDWNIKLPDLKPESLRCFLDTANRERTMEFLEDQKTDWQTNLILYALTERDAVALYSCGFSDDDIELWRLSGKQKDIEFWKTYLAADHSDVE